MMMAMGLPIRKILPVIITHPIILIVHEAILSGVVQVKTCIGEIL
jgi:hypothetical protein